MHSRIVNLYQLLQKLVNYFQPIAKIVEIVKSSTHDINHTRLCQIYEFYSASFWSEIVFFFFLVLKRKCIFNSKSQSGVHTLCKNASKPFTHKFPQQNRNYKCWHFILMNVDGMCMCAIFGFCLLSGILRLFCRKINIIRAQPLNIRNQPKAIFHI